MIDIPAETTISRYAIPALNLLMRCEASFPAPTPKERSAPPPTRTSLDVVVNHRRGRKCESDAGSLPLHVFYKKPCEPVIERPDLLVATAAFYSRSIVRPGPPSQSTIFHAASKNVRSLRIVRSEGH